jgi:LacI family transcriptional regulator
MLTDPPDLPIVVIQPRIETTLPVVEFDDEAAVRLLVRHLRELGHAELLWLGPLPAQLSRSSIREQAFMTEVWDAQLRGGSCRFDRNAEREKHPDLDPDDLLMTIAENALAQLLAEQGDGRRFTAVVCYNDLVAIGACRALARRGLRVPQDVSVVGFDNAEAPFASPPLTTIDHKLPQMGRRAGELVLEMVTGGESVRHARRGYRDVLAPDLIVRASSGPAPQPRPA